MSDDSGDERKSAGDIRVLVEKFGKANEQIGQSCTKIQNSNDTLIAHQTVVAKQMNALQHELAQAKIAHQDSIKDLKDDIRDLKTEQKNLTKQLSDFQSETKTILQRHSKILDILLGDQIRRALEKTHKYLTQYCAEKLKGASIYTQFMDAFLQELIPRLREYLLNSADNSETTLTNVEKSIQSDIDSLLALGINKRFFSGEETFKKEAREAFNRIVNTGKYIPTQPGNQSPRNDVKKNNNYPEEGVVTTVQSQAGQNTQVKPTVVVPASQQVVQPAPQPVQPLLYYDADERDIDGIDKFVTDLVPYAVKLGQGVSVLQPCVVVSFIIVNDRVDVNKWKPLCEERQSKSGGHHYVVQVHNIALQNTHLTTTWDAVEVIKAAIKVEFDRYGMNKPPKRIFIPGDCGKKISQIMANYKRV